MAYQLKRLLVRHEGEMMELKTNIVTQIQSWVISCIQATSGVLLTGAILYIVRAEKAKIYKRIILR